jgi:hypothetical protein
LPITAALNDTDGSETLSISIKNLPSEITFNNGIKQADGSYLLSQNDHGYVPWPFLIHVLSPDFYLE